MARRGAVQTRVTGLRLEGADTLEATLKGLERDVRARVVGAGLRAGAEVLRAGMARRAPAGTLARNIVADVTPDPSAPKADAYVGPAKKVQHLGYWFEWGTQAHEIVAGKFVARRRGRRGGARTRSEKRALASSAEVFGTRVQHPGMRPKPFAVATFVEDSPRALAAMARAIWDELRAAMGRGR